MAQRDPADIARIAELERENAELRKMVKDLLQRVAELEARLNQNSSNSSKPPSSDPPGLERRKKPPTGRKPGGQPGHDPHKREMLPVDKVDTLVPLIPERCRCCDARLRGKDPEPLRHQVTEVPRFAPVVTEYQQHALDCEKCGARTRAPLPDGVPAGNFGPRLMAMAAICTGKYRLSKRVAEELIQDFLGVDVALGSICKMEQVVSAAVAARVEEARAFVREQAVVHPDETGWREGNAKAWLWVAATAMVTVFRISRSRGSDVARDLLGENFKGRIVSDRWSAYAWIDLARRQICWSHLLRDFQGFVDRGGKGRRIGQALIDYGKVMFGWWDLVRAGTMSRKRFRERMEPVQREVRTLLRAGTRCETTRGKSREILKLESALWTFVGTNGIEPTNNFAERCIRPAVLWRKGSFGTHSEDGSRFVERILTVVATLRQQRRHVLEYLTTACEAALLNKPAPSLLPATK